MKIENLCDFAANSVIETDLVIIGGGPAGLTVAAELSASDLQIVIVESGLDHETPKHAELNRIESDGAPTGEASADFRKHFHGPAVGSFDPEVQPFGIRSRGLGGSARFWGGKTALFDDSDFEARPWVPHSGWPIAKSDLVPYFERASAALNLGPNEGDDALWNRIDPRVPRPRLDLGVLRSFFWQFSHARRGGIRALDFVEEFRERLSSHTRILLDATVTQVNTTRSGEAFESVDLSTAEGVCSKLFAKRCVLAAGGIENPRLLLVSSEVKPQGIGNDHDQVGRYLMDHPGTEIGHFRREELAAAHHLGCYTIRDQDKMRVYSRGLTLSEAVKRREKLLNGAAYVVPEIAEDDPVEALRRIALRTSQHVVKDFLAPVLHPIVFSKSLVIQFLQDPRVPAAPQKMILDLLSRHCPVFMARAFQAYGVPRRWDRLILHAITEQEPNPESRVTLSDDRDMLGIPLAHAHWIISKNDRRSIQRLATALRDELPKLGLPAPVLEDWITNDRLVNAPLVDMGHVIGTTRMSTDPRTGVVDTDCQVWGVSGLYVAGSSVFPTSSHVNPTLMLTSLAIRLADRLADPTAP